MQFLVPLVGAAAGKMAPNAVSWLTGANATPGANTASPAMLAANSPDQLGNAINAAPIPAQPSLFSSIFGAPNGNGAPSSSTAPSMPSNAPFPTSDGSLPPTQDFNSYYGNAGNAGFWQGLASKTGPGSIIGTIAGAVGGRDAAQLNAQNTYLDALKNRTGVQDSQLQLFRQLGILQSMGNSVNPNNIPASYSGAGGSASPAPAPAPVPAPLPNAPFMPMPGAPPIAVGAPMPQGASPAPIGVPLTKNSPAMVAPAGSTTDPLADRRAFLMQQAQTLMRYGDTNDALQMMTQARVGLPAGTDVDGAGRVVDAVTRQPVGLNTQQYAAQGAGMVSRAQADAGVPAAETIADNTAKQQRQTDAFAARFRFSNKPGVDANGNAAPMSDYDVATGTGAAAQPGVSMPPADNPYRVPQMKEVADAQKVSEDAVAGQNEVQQLSGAIKNFGLNGPWAQHALTAMNWLNSVDALDPATQSKLASGEFANMDANSIVSAMAKAAAAGRVPLGIYNQISRTKPSILSGNPSLALEALNQDFQRQQDLAAFKSSYYSNPANRTKLDAEQAFNTQNPLEMYQSRVVPLPTPTDGKFKMGYGYQMKNGQVGIFTGTGFKRTGVWR